MSKVLFALGDKFSIPLHKSITILSKKVYEEKIDVVVLVGTKDILDSISDLKSFYKNKYGEEMNVSVLILKNLDDLNYVFKRFKYKIREFPNSKIRINYTNGSSKLAAISIIVAKMYGFKVEDGFTIDDTAKLNEFDVVEEKTSGSIMYIIKKLFNNYDFVVSKQLLEENYSSLDVVEQMFTKIIDLYGQWDSFNYQYKDYDDLKDFFSNLEDLPNNLEALKILSDKNNKLFNSYKIADLLNNAERRMEERKYEDAIIRLYRTLELIAEAELLEKYGIKKNDVRINEIKQLDIEKTAIKTIIQRLDYKYPKYNLSLTSSFFLLQKLYDDVGKHYYYHKDEYQQVFQKRNISILVHGNYTYDLNEVKKTYDLVISMAKIYDKNMDKYLEYTKFPTFKI